LHGNPQLSLAVSVVQGMDCIAGALTLPISTIHLPAIGTASATASGPNILPGRAKQKGKGRNHGTGRNPTFESSCKQLSGSYRGTSSISCVRAVQKEGTWVQVGRSKRMLTHLDRRGCTQHRCSNSNKLSLSVRAKDTRQRTADKRI